MPENESTAHIAIIVYFSASKSKLIEWLYQSIWGLNSANQDMSKITGWFNLKTIQYLTAIGVVSGANYTKIIAIYKEIKLNLLEILICKGLAHNQSLD